MRAATGSEPVRQAFEVDLIDPVEDRHHGLASNVMAWVGPAKTQGESKVPAVQLTLPALHTQGLISVILFDFDVVTRLLKLRYHKKGLTAAY